MDGIPTRFPKKLVLIVIAIIGLILIYGLFWLNFFGVLKIPQILKLAPQEKTELLSPKEQQKINQLIELVKTFKTPLDKAISQSAHQGTVATIEIDLNTAREALKNGDQAKADLYLTSAKLGIIRLGESSSEKRITPEEQQKHDPKNKYIKGDIVDPRVKDVYLQVIDLLVETDRNY